jgi:chromosome segregation ATPase
VTVVQTYAITICGLVAVPGGAGDDEDEAGTEVSTEPRAKPAKAKGRTGKAPAPKEDPRLRRLRVQRDEAADAARAAAQSAVRAGEKAVATEREAEAAATEIERLERDVRAAKRRQRAAAESAAQAASALKKSEADAERARKKVEDLQARIERLLG